MRDITLFVVGIVIGGFIVANLLASLDEMRGRRERLLPSWWPLHLKNKSKKK